MDDIIREIDILYSKLYRLNKKLLEKTGKEKHKCSCTDVMDFYITSHGLSFLKDIYLGLVQSSGFFLNARCILEGLAVKRFCQLPNSMASVDLLAHQTPILEYKLYKNFEEDVLEKILFPEKLVNDYKESVTFFETELDDKYSKSTIQSIIKSKIPFICSPNTNYRKLIGELLGEHFADLYGLMSQTIHPSLNDEYNQFELLGLTKEVHDLLLAEYENFYPNQNGVKYHCSIIFANPIPRKLLEFEDEIGKELEKIASAIEKKYSKNYISDTLRTLDYLKKEMLIDTSLGLCEQTKSKWKVYLDLIAVMHEMYFSGEGCEERFKLLCRHIEMQANRNIGSKYNTDVAYEIYSKIYSDGVDRLNFDNKFQSMTGYLIDKKGRVKSFSKLVNDFVNLFKDKNSVVSTTLKIDYLESQLMSHANGYMFYSNSGAWSDVTNILLAADRLILFELELLNDSYREYDTINNTNELKPTINLIRNSIKNIQSILSQKENLLSMPKQHLGDMM